MAPRKTNSWIGIGAGVTVAVIVAAIVAVSFLRPGDATVPNQTQQTPQNPQRGPQRETERDAGPDADAVPQKPIRESDKETGE
jgi:hypothetical protein